MRAIGIGDQLVKVGGRLRFALRRGTGASIPNNHAMVLPSATYSPWQTDSEFLQVYSVARRNTLVDAFRCYELWQLVDQTSRLSGDLLEVGVWRGGTGAIIAKSASRANNSDRVYLCDTFTGVVKASAADSNYSGGEHSDTSVETVRELMTRLSIRNVELLQGIFPDQTASRIRGQRIRFCHIDVDVYQSAKDVFDWVWPRMPVGGVIVYDDYGFETCDGITRIVDEHRGKPDRLVIHNLNGHGIVVRTA